MRKRTSYYKINQKVDDDTIIKRLVDRDMQITYGKIPDTEDGKLQKELLTIKRNLALLQYKNKQIEAKIADKNINKNLSDGSKTN